MLRTLGGLELEGSAFRWPKPLLLLAHLALEGQQDRRRLARLFWPEATDPMNSLTVALSQLRKGAPGTLEADRQTVQTSLACDACELSAALESEQLERALDLYRGPFLDGLHLQTWGVELEEWLYDKREQLAGLLRRTLLERANAKAAKGQFALAAHDAEVAAGLSEAAPLAPEALEHLYALLLAGGSPRAEAVREEAMMFGAALPDTPEEARARLLAALGASAIPHNLPRYSVPLVGREAELEMLEALLARPDVGLVTLVGPGGIGKTRLAVALAEQQVGREDARFAHGITFVPLASISGEGLLPAISEALGVPADPQQTRPQQRLLDYLRSKRMLLLLDNFEHLLGEGSGLLSEMLQAAPGVKLLVTSRERLRLREEQVLHLHGLELRGEAAESTDYPAAELFCQRAQRLVPDFTVTSEAAHLRDICRLVEGMPLGLELAATWADTLPLADIAAGIRESLDFLETELRDVPERHRSLRAVFDYSYARLAPREQEVFAGLSVFRGGFTREAAECVSGASARTLSVLVGKSLLRFERTQNRYFLHELLRQYGADQLTRVGASEEAQNRHSAYFCDRLERLADLEADSENVQAAWHWAAAHGYSERLGAAADALGTFFQQRGRFQDGARAFDAALRSQTEPKLTAKLLAWRGVFGYLLGQAEAAGRLEESLALLDEAEGSGEEVESERAFALLQLGRIKLETDTVVAERLGAESLALYRVLEAPAGAAAALSVLGEAAYRRGDGGEAWRLLEEGLTLYRRLGDLRGVAGLLPMLSFMAMVGTHFEEAARLAKESYALCRHIGEGAGVAAGLSLLGMSQFWLGRFAEARSLFEESLTLHEELGNRPALPQAHAYVGLAGLRLGRYEEARGHGERGLALAREFGNTAMVGWCLWLLGCAALGLGQYGEAKRLLEASVAAYRDIGQASELGWSLAVLSCAERKLGRPQQARRILLEVLAKAAEVKDFPSTILALPTLALLLADAGREARAVELLSLMLRYPVVAHCHWFEDIAVRKLNAVAANLPPQVADEAKARGQELELWDTVNGLLSELAARGWDDEDMAV